MYQSDTYQRKKLCELFKLLNQAELKSQNVQRHSIVLMGLSRSGKSAVTNWLFDPSSMVGERKGTNVFYVPAQQAKKEGQGQVLKMAAIGHGFASVTIMANMRVSDIDREKVAEELVKEQREAEVKIKKLDIKKALAFRETKKIKGSEEKSNTDISFLDFGGYGERRDVFQIIKVNYVLASFLLKMSKVKFVLVITQHAFNDISSNGLRDTLCQFLRLFDFELIPKQEQQNFFRSISLCITSVTPVYDEKLKTFSQVYDDSIIVEQLKIILEKFNDKSLFNESTKQNTYIQNYPLCKRLLEELIRSKRFQQFPKAVPKISPSKSNMIRNLNSGNWEYFRLQKCKYALCYPYVEQYYRLKEEDKNMLSNIILQKFKTNELIKQLLKRMLATRYENICNDEISFKQQFADLEDLLCKDNIYADLPRQFPDEIKGSAIPSWVSRIDSLTNLCEHCFRLSSYGNWLTQTENIKNSGKDDSLARYYQYLAGWFTKQMVFIQKLFGQTPKQRQLFKKIQFVFKKAFNQALVFENLNNNIAERGSDLANIIRFKLLDSSSFANQLADSEKSIKLNALAQLTKKVVKAPQINQQKAPKINSQKAPQTSSQKALQISPQKALQIINMVEHFQRELKEVDSLQAYIVCHKYSLAAIAEPYKFEPKKAMNYLVMSLEYCIKQQICLQVYQDEPTLQTIKANQKECVKHLIQMLKNTHSKSIIQLAMHISKILKQYSMADNLYKFMQEKMPKIHDYRSHAQFYLGIGRQNDAIDCYSKFLSPIELKQKTYIIKNQAIQNHRILELCKKEENEIMPKQALEKVVSLIKMDIFGQKASFQINSQLIRRNYGNKIGSIVKDRTFFMDLPKNPTNYQLLSYSNQLIKHAESKKVTIMIKSRPKNGQTTLAYALTNSTLMAKEYGKDYRFQLLDRCGSKINHGDNPTEYPHLRSIDQNQILVDFVNINQKNVDKKVLAAILLQNLIEKSSEVRFMLVQSQKGILQNNGVQLVKLMNMLSTFFAQEQMKKLHKSSIVSKAILLAVTNVTSSSPIWEKLKYLAKKLGQKSNVVDNQRQFSLNQSQQFIVANMLKAVSTSGGRAVFFNKAKKEQKTFKNIDWVSKLEKQQVLCKQCKSAEEKCTHNWRYLEKSAYLKEKTCGQVFSKIFLSSQVEAFSNSIKEKIGLLNEIFEDLFEKMEKQFKDQLSTQVATQQTYQIDKWLRILSSLYKIKYFFTRSFDYQLPQHYHQYYQMLKQFRFLIITHIKENSKSWSQEQIALKDQLTNNLMEQLQEYSQKLNLQNIVTIRYNLNQIKDFQMRLQGNIGGGNYFDELSEYFKKHVSLEFIKKMPAAETRERLLRSYDEIWTIFGKHQCRYENAIPYSQWAQTNRQLRAAQIETYRQMKRKRQLLIINFKMLNEIIENPFQHEEISIKESTDSKIVQICQALQDIAKEVANTQPEISKRICLELGQAELLEEIYEIIYQGKQRKSQKVAVMVQRIYMALAMGQLETAKKLHKKLLTMTQKSNELLTVDKVRDYAKKNNLTVEVPKLKKLLTVEGLRQFVQELQKDVV